MKIAIAAPVLAVLAAGCAGRPRRPRRTPAYSTGLVVGNFEWMAPFMLILLGLVFAPFCYRTRIATLPEFLEGRYGPAPRTFLAFTAVVGALFIHIGFSLYAGTSMFQSFVDVDFRLSILVVSLATVIYTVLGGLKAVVVTESIKSVLLLEGRWRSRPSAWRRWGTPASARWRPLGGRQGPAN